jgi:6-phosphogluconate dehydrogenase
VVDPTIERMAPLAALDGRFASRGPQDFANRLLSALREKLGGHEERPA